jgi:hypothetical protein
VPNEEDICSSAGLAVADANLSGGSATGGLSTSTKPEGLGAKIEASDITKESTDDVLVLSVASLALLHYPACVHHSWSLMARRFWQS